ncbi:MULTISPECIES: helix-turn-helix domain-containing protein [unclassified Novosphingobium]|uniref:helix-turn-helix domain-containing protein n=1 Tax=Novosphingobium TaxID=165696 RepID=UPI00144851E8|nr:MULTISPECIES: AraC family transcriptional regulator [unclassified Novosphingobium]NKJ42322.1 AraC family transcriptional regulator [Novosphingobium sp. SG720]NMN04705.1 AraC family transcriptional regulator [Novosphingobium sp. SG919]NMN85301.1 AraC family transcriptional regulator [Novosphingobium sp. SG916]
MGNRQTTNETIIADTIGRAPDRSVNIGAWQFARWRQFIGSYELPALVDPVFVVHVGGKPDTRLWEADHWSAARSIPGCATIVPAGCRTGWRIDGELDVVTVSVPLSQLQQEQAFSQFREMRFAFADPLGIALTRQILGELYGAPTPERTAYIGTLLDALKAHTLRGSALSNEGAFPSADFSAYRIHQIMNDILARPEAEHSLEALAAKAGLTPSHFCRVFKRATGVSPHQYVMKARLDRARDLLGQSDLSVAQVADMTGFTSQSHFTRAFRQYAGQTPSSWRHPPQ